jgi:sugar phosphate isomerase/epimerase
MKNLFGTIQGRLLPKYKGRYQAHPLGYWEDEFHIAKDIGLDCVEFILDYNDADQNPMLNSDGLEKLKLIIASTGVIVKTVCADYFMEAPLHSENDAISDKSMSVLNKLLESASQLNVSDIVIPCVDQSSLSSDIAMDRFVQKINKVIPIIEKRGINLSLETDLDPVNFLKLLNKFDSKRITVNYDIGNSASLGFDPIEELKAYGNRITDIHIKDRLLGGGPVFLGTGNANFEKFFSALSVFQYKGPFIMQAYRDSEGVEIFKKQLEYIKEIISNHLK